MAQYAVLATPGRRRVHEEEDAGELPDNNAQEHQYYSEQRVDVPKHDDAEQELHVDRVRRRSGVDQRKVYSEASSNIRGVDAARSMGQVYEPSLQEKAQVALEGRWGFYLEMTNFVLSMCIFSIYIAELYDRKLSDATWKTVVEILITLFFIFDLAIHIFVAPKPWKYLSSPHGIIDLLTIIPSIIVFMMPSSRSQFFFVLRVLRIFRALRVLRLKQFLRFRKSGFDYELGVFMLSTCAVILCAAGMFQALEEDLYIDNEQTLSFHNALYFVLVSISTIGYGDITPKTTMGHIFVMVLIVGVFTIVPHEVNKLNNLAKQSYEWDKDYYPKHNSSGHVIVSGYALTTDAVLDFLQEFYHTSRGTINLDVVFLSDSFPAADLVHALSMEKYRQRTCYLRGSLANSQDQSRAQMENATAVFLISNKSHHQDSKHHDAVTILYTLSVRNFSDSHGNHLDIYVQLSSREEEFETTAGFLGAITTRTSALKSMILARSALCPGASTLILNLLHSPDIAEYSKRNKWSKVWIQEYLDGMCYQIFPIIFSERFQFEKYEEVARNLYERYGSLLITVYDKRAQRRSDSSGGGSATPLAPFQTYIREGDIGFVIAKSASVVLHIVNSYGDWRDEEGADVKSPRATNFRPVRVSSESLLKRPSPSTSFRQSRRVDGSSGLVEALNSQTKKSNADHSSSNQSRDANERNSWGGADNNLTSQVDDDTDRRPPVIKMLSSTDERIPQNINSSSHGTTVMQAARLKCAEDVQKALQEEHHRDDTKHMRDHYLVCAGNLCEALALVNLLKCYHQLEHQSRYRSQTHDPVPRSQLSVRFTSRCFVLLVDALPSAKLFMDSIEDCSICERDDHLLQDVYFVAGSPAKPRDLARVSASKARQLLILPFEEQFRSPNSSESTSQLPLDNKFSAYHDDDSLADFGVLSSLLAVEITRQHDAHQIAIPKRSPASPRRRLTSRAFSMELGGHTAEIAPPSYLREVDQGLPVESVKLRMMERFPDLDPAVFRGKKELIDARLHEYDVQQQRHSQTDQAAVTEPLLAEKALGVLYHSKNARFCRPRDPEVCHDEFPYLAPAFASGNIFLSSVLDRIVCQGFYNPYITDVIESLVSGSPAVKSASSMTNRVTRVDDAADNSGHLGPNWTNLSFAPDSNHRRLFRVKVENSHIGGTFLDVFLKYLRLEMLVIGILRSPNPALENLLPFVYTCPDPDTILHAKDRLFVLG